MLTFGESLRIQALFLTCKRGYLPFVCSLRLLVTPSGYCLLLCACSVSSESLFWILILCTCYRFYTGEKHSSCVLQGGNTSIANTGQPYKILGDLLQILSSKPLSHLTTWLRPPSSHLLRFCNGRRIRLKHKTDRFEVSSSDRLPGQVTWSSAMHYVSD